MIWIRHVVSDLMGAAAMEVGPNMQPPAIIFEQPGEESPVYMDPRADWERTRALEELGDAAPRFLLHYHAEHLLAESLRAVTFRNASLEPEQRADDSPLALLNGLSPSDLDAARASVVGTLSLALRDTSAPFALRIECRGSPTLLGFEPDVVTLYNFAFGVANTIGVWAAAAPAVWLLISRLRKVTRGDVQLDTGTALIIAAGAITEQTGERDLSLAFSTPIASYVCPGTNREVEGGFAVGFRDDVSLRLALLDLTGEHCAVRLHPFPMPYADLKHHK